MSVEFRWIIGVYTKHYMHTRGPNGYMLREFSIHSFTKGEHAGQTAVYKGGTRLGFFPTLEAAKQAAETTYLLGEQ